MRDFSEPKYMPEEAPSNPAKTCLRCELEFIPKRPNQKYCSKDCQKRASRNSARGDRTKENEGANERHFERAYRLEEMVYSAVPTERLGVMKDILDYVKHDTGLRRILTDPKLLTAEPNSDGRRNIAKAASAYTVMFYGVSIQTYVRQVLDGSLNENHEVVRQVVASPPQWSPSEKKFRQRFALTSEALFKEAQRRFDEDMQRVNGSVAVAQARVDTLMAAGFTVPPQPDSNP